VRLGAPGGGHRRTPVCVPSPPAVAVVASPPPSPLPAAAPAPPPPRPPPYPPPPTSPAPRGRPHPQLLDGGDGQHEPPHPWRVSARPSGPLETSVQPALALAQPLSARRGCVGRRVRHAGEGLAEAVASPKPPHHTPPSLGVGRRGPAARGGHHQRFRSPQPGRNKRGGGECARAGPGCVANAANAHWPPGGAMLAPRGAERRALGRPPAPGRRVTAAWGDQIVLYCTWV